MMMMMRRLKYFIKFVVRNEEGACFMYYGFIKKKKKKKLWKISGNWYAYDSFVDILYDDNSVAHFKCNNLCAHIRLVFTATAKAGACTTRITKC